MCEINTLKRILIEIGEGKKCFAIFDEIFTSTNPDDALVIVEKPAAQIKFPQQAPTPPAAQGSLF